MRGWSLQAPVKALTHKSGAGGTTTPRTPLAPTTLGTTPSATWTPCQATYWAGNVRRMPCALQAALRGGGRCWVSNSTLLLLCHCVLSTTALYQHGVLVAFLVPTLLGRPNRDVSLAPSTRCFSKCGRRDRERSRRGHVRQGVRVLPLRRSVSNPGSGQGRAGHCKVVSASQFSCHSLALLTVGYLRGPGTRTPRL